MVTKLPLRKGKQQPPLSKFTGGGIACIHIIRGPCPLWPNGWMDQDAIWYGGRPRPSPHCVRLRPSSPPKKAAQQPPIFGPSLLWQNGWMDQDEAGHGGRPRPWPHCVRWGPSSPSPKEAQPPPIFSPCLLWPNGWMDQDATW